VMAARAVAVLATIALLLAAGCGGSGGDDQSSQPQLTKSQFVRRANAYCTRGYKAQAKAMEKYARSNGISVSPTQAEREEMNTAVVLGFVRDKIEFFKTTPAPEGDEDEIRRIVESMEAGLERSEKTPAALAKPIEPEPFTQTRHLTAEYGPYVCGQA
jgi:hypothetical protein